MKTNLAFSLFISFFVLSCQNEVEEEISVENEVAEVSDEEAVQDSSEVTCPSCGFTFIEVLPTEYCLLSLDCKSCGESMHPGPGDCCVFCTHGTIKCPSIQELEQE